MLNYLDTVISQYRNSPVINFILQNCNGYIDPSADIDAFYNLIWNVETAQGIGLDIWGRIVGVQRILFVPQGKYFGFDEATTVSADPFGQSPLYSGAATTSNFALSDTAFRVLIYAKALSNICDGSIPAINQVMRLLFPGRGNCYVTDGQDMTITYAFTFLLTPVEAAIVSQSNILPKPAGVQATVVQI